MVVPLDVTPRPPADVAFGPDAATLAHLERGARIAFRALEAQAVPHALDELEWYVAELKRSFCDVYIVKRAAGGELAHQSRVLERENRAMAEEVKRGILSSWKHRGAEEVETDGAYWAVEIREATE